MEQNCAYEFMWTKARSAIMFRSATSWLLLSGICSHQLAASSVLLLGWLCAMISLGHFSYDDHSDGTGEPDQEFLFLDAHRDHHLFTTPSSQLRVHLYLGTHHDAAGGTLTHLDLAVRHYDWAGGEIEMAPIGSLDPYSLRYLLTFLAGVQPFELAEASRVIESWGS